MPIKVSNTDNTKTSNAQILVYGECGAGKTPLLATTGGTPLILNIDKGLASIAGTGIDVVDIDSVADFREAYKYILANEQYDWISVDGISALAKLVFAEEVQTLVDAAQTAREKAGRAHEKVNPMEGVNKLQAYGEMAHKCIVMLDALKKLGRNLVVTAQVDKVTNPLTGLRTFGPSTLGKYLQDELPGMFNQVFAARVGEYEDGSPYTFLQTQGCREYVARDRTNKLDMYEMPSEGRFPSLQAIMEKIRA